MTHIKTKRSFLRCSHASSTRCPQHNSCSWDAAKTRRTSVPESPPLESAIMYSCSGFATMFRQFSAHLTCSSFLLSKKGSRMPRLRLKHRVHAACFRRAFPSLLELAPTRYSKPLDAGAEAWSAQAIDLYRHPADNRVSAALDARAAGFDIADSAAWLTDYYQMLIHT